MLRAREGHDLVVEHLSKCKTLSSNLVSPKTKKEKKAGVVVRAYNPSTQEAEARGSRVQGYIVSSRPA
jgi:hypothetical protein